MTEFAFVVLILILAGTFYYVYRLRHTIRQKTILTDELRRTLSDYQRTAALNTARWSNLADTAYDALLVLDVECRIINLNQSAKDLFGQPDAIGKNLVEVTNTHELEIILQGAYTNDDETFEEQIKIDDRYFRVRAQVFRQNNQQVVGMALQDISQLVRLNRARRDMVANISHELRTPIANIRLIIEGLFHERDKPKRKESIESLHAVARETDTLLWLVQEMADLSMIESGQAIVRMYNVPLLELVDEAIQHVADQSEAKSIEIAREIPERIHVLCDRDLTRRVLVNLIHNAIKWSPKKNVITVNAVNGGDEVVIGVLDNGPGVPNDQTERIFERFYQVDASRSGHEGTGLGLAICRHVVEAHGGRIWAEGNNGGSAGGRFKFTLLSAENNDPETLADNAVEAILTVENASAAEAANEPEDEKVEAKAE